MVVDAHAVVDPRAMVVVSFDTAPAHRAVLRAWGHKDFAVGAELAGVDLL